MSLWEAAVDIFGKKKKKNGVSDTDSRQAGLSSPPHTWVTLDKKYGDMLCSPSVVLVCLASIALPLGETLFLCKSS